MAQETKNISRYFLFLALAVAFYFAYLIFKPFISVLLLAAIFATILYPLYTRILEKLKGRETWAALLTVIIFVLLIVIPLGNFVVLLAHESGETYALLQEKFSNGELNVGLSNIISTLQAWQERFLPFVDASAIDIRQIVLDFSSSFNSFVIGAASTLIRGTTQFITSLFFMLISLFFLLKDGEALVKRMSYLTPLSSKYDLKLFDKFRDVSRSTILGSLLVGLVQGVLAGIAYLIVGLPALFLGVATGVASFIPVVGTAIVTIPVLIGLAIVGRWQAFLFVAIWCVGLVGLSDNVLRTYAIKGKSQIHPLLLFFSILGGIEAFGFQGLIFGPLILAIILTVLHIYELEYEHVLER